MSLENRSPTLLADAHPIAPSGFIQLDTGENSYPIPLDEIITIDSILKKSFDPETGISIFSTNKYSHQALISTYGHGWLVVKADPDNVDDHRYIFQAYKEIPKTTEAEPVVLPL